jgi:hypothetical protein
MGNDKKKQDSTQQRKIPDALMCTGDPKILVILKERSD